MPENKKITERMLIKAGATIWEKAGKDRLYLNESLEWVLSEYPDLKAILTDKEELSDEDLHNLTRVNPYVNRQGKNFGKVGYYRPNTKDKTKDEKVKKFFSALDEKLDTYNFIPSVIDYSNCIYNGFGHIKIEDLPLVISIFISLFGKNFKYAESTIRKDEGKSKKFETLESFEDFLKKTPPQAIEELFLLFQDHSLKLTRIDTSFTDYSQNLKTVYKSFIEIIIDRDLNG